MHFSLLNFCSENVLFSLSRDQLDFCSPSTNNIKSKTHSLPGVRYFVLFFFPLYSMGTKLSKIF